MFPERDEGWRCSIMVFGFGKKAATVSSPALRAGLANSSSKFSADARKGPATVTAL